MNTIDAKIDELIKTYTPVPGTDVNEYRKQIYEVVQDCAKALLDAKKPNRYALLTVPELEDLLLMVRDLKARYENSASTTVSDVLKLDEIKQWEYKLTERILSNR
jgi:hypothetical protein